MPDLRAEHGLAHHVEIARGGTRTRRLFDFGLTPESMNHNLRELGPTRAWSTRSPGATATETTSAGSSAPCTRTGAACDAT